MRERFGVSWSVILCLLLAILCASSTSFAQAASSVPASSRKTRKAKPRAASIDVARILEHGLSGTKRRK